MIFPGLMTYSGIGLLLLRLLIGIIFFSSGWAHAFHPAERSKSIEMSTTFTFGLGLVELLGALFLILGIYVQPASFLLMLVMAGAIYKKQFKWHKGFYSGSAGTEGWHYDLLLLFANLLFLLTGGGKYVLGP
jgi:putative oxidoreductase